MCRHYKAKPRTRRWPMAVFYALLDIAALNAYVIWNEANPGWLSSSTGTRRLRRSTGGDRPAKIELHIGYGRAKDRGAVGGATGVHCSLRAILTCSRGAPDVLRRCCRSTLLPTGSRIALKLLPTCSRLALELLSG